MNENIKKVNEKIVETSSGIVDTIKSQSKGFILGLGAGVLLTGPWPGGFTIAVIGVGIIVASLFISSEKK